MQAARSRGYPGALRTILQDVVLSDIVSAQEL